MDPLSLRDISPKVEKISGYTKISNGPEFYPPSGGQGGKDTNRNLNSLGRGAIKHIEINIQGATMGTGQITYKSFQINPIFTF